MGGVVTHTPSAGDHLLTPLRSSLVAAIAMDGLTTRRVYGRDEFGSDCLGASSGNRPRFDSMSPAIIRCSCRCRLCFDLKRVAESRSVTGHPEKVPVTVDIAQTGSMLCLHGSFGPTNLLAFQKCVDDVPIVRQLNTVQTGSLP